MGLNVGIKDCTGTDYCVQVTPENSLLVTSDGIPPFEPQHINIFRQYLTNDGTKTGSNDMLVNGSVNAQDFYVQADEENDRYITTLSFVIADTGNFNMREFANIGLPLTNGCRLFYNSIRGEVDIHDSLQSNFDFIRLGFGEPAFGSAANTFRGTNFVGTAEAIMPIVDLKRMLPPFGIKLDAKSNQRLTLRVQDNISAGIVAFDCIAYGFNRFPDGRQLEQA